MKLSIAVRQLVTVFAIAFLMAGCGGGGDTGTGGETGRLRNVFTAGAMAAPAPLTAAQLMDWAEANYPQYFPTSGKVEDFLFPYTYRYYPATQNYLGVSTESADVAIHLYGEIAGWEIRRLTALSDYTCTVLPQNCAVGGPGTFIGHTVSTTNFHGTASDLTIVLGPHDTVAGDGIELMNGFGGFATIDISGASIRITAATDQPFGYFELLRFADANGTISPIASVTVDPSTNYAGFNASRLAVTADQIDVNMTALPGRQGQQILLNVVFAAP